MRASVVTDTEALTLIGGIARNVELESVICTDAHAAYRDLADRYIHEVVDHGTAFVIGRTHVAKYHLFRYVTEQVFQFNERGCNDAGRFLRVMRGVVGKRLTYRRLCCIGGAEFMGLE